MATSEAPVGQLPAEQDAAQDIAAQTGLQSAVGTSFAARPLPGGSMGAETAVAQPPVEQEAAQDSGEEEF